jgi:hypothetical protein
MAFFILVAALAGCHNTDRDTTDTVGINDDTGANPDDTGVKGTATLQYTVSVLGNEEPCQINLVCTGTAIYIDSFGMTVEVGADTPFSVPSGTTVEVAAPTSCEITAGLTGYTETFGYPVHLGEDGEYWAAKPLDLDVNPDQQVSGDFSTFNVFQPGDFVCAYDKYALDTGAADLKGEQWMDHEEIDKQFVSVLQDGVIETENDQNMDVIGRDEDHMQVVGEELVLVVEAGGNPYYIAESDIGVDYFTLTVVNTEAGYVADVECDLDE